MIHDRSFQLLVLVLSCLATTIIGCTSPKVILPDLSSDHIKAFNSVKIYANRSEAVKTGVNVAKGDFYTLIVTGHVSTTRHDRPSVGYPGSKPERKLYVIINQELQIAPPINATLDSPVSGEISLVVYDYGFLPEYGYAKFNNEFYKDNSGSFNATIIVWKTKDIDEIVTFMSQLKLLNPYNEVSERLIAQANSLKDSLAETKFASTPHNNKQKERIETSTVPSISDEVAVPTSQPDEFAISDPGTQQEESSQANGEQNNTSKVVKDQYSPLMLLLSPVEGQIVKSATIQLIGVVEDDTALLKVEITVNGKPITFKIDRGISLDSIELPARLEFNEKLPIIVGTNQIKIRAEDINGRISEKLISVERVESKGTVWAAIIGVNEYPNLPQLKYAVNDALAFHDFLLETEFVKPENVFHMTNDQATLNSLRSILGTKLKKRARKEDRVIIYFAGHGATERDPNSPDGDGLEKYLLPYDADPNDLYATALPMREIAYILNRIQSHSLIFIADSCYSGASGGRTVSIGGIRSTLSDNFIDRIAGGKGRVILTASAANEVSMEDERLKHGIFTYYLIQGLRGLADYDSDSYVTVDEAYRYVSEEVPKATDQEQHPVKKGSVEGQLVLGITK